MGIFDKFFSDKKEQKTNTFEEKIILTDNVNRDLIKISKEYNLPISSLDFDILKTKTFISIEGEDFVEADEHTIELIKTEKFLLNPDNKIKQVYEIKVKKYKPSDSFEIIGKMAINRLFTKAQFKLSEKSVLKSYNEIKFYDEMNKKKIRNSLLIKIFSDKMEEDIKNLTEKILEGKIENEFIINLCEGINPVQTVQGEINFLYKKRKKSIKKELIYPIKEKEKIIEIIKPKEGIPGRNCKGEIIEIEKIKNFEIPQISFDKETIEKKETDEYIVFIAKKPGYIVKEDGTFKIKDSLEIRKIDIKTGDVKEADESNVKMEIKESSYMEEAVADGMTVEAKEVTIKGNTGNASKIKAQILKIEGKTHKNSIINAKEAFINTHRGKIKAKNITVNNLEGGMIKAEKAVIKNAIGGMITAKEVIIENIISHVKIYALKYIDIENLKGEENLFCISPKKVLQETDIDALRQKIDETERNIDISKREYRKIKKLLDSNRQNYEDMKFLYQENKKNNRKTSPSVLMKLKNYRQTMEKLNIFKIKIKNLQEEKEILLDEIESIQNAVYNAKIICKTPWKAYNRIEFDLLEPPVSFKYDTKGNEGVCGFKIKFIGETPKIVKIKVENDSGS